MNKKIAVLFVLILAVGFLFGCALNRERLALLVDDGEYDSVFSSGVRDLSVMTNELEKSAVWLKTEVIFRAMKKDGTEALFTYPIVATAFVVELPEGYPSGKCILALYHTTSTDKLVASTPYGPVVISEEKVRETTYILHNNEWEEVQPLFKRQREDLALFRLPKNINIPSIPYSFGNSDDLQIGTGVCVFGRTLSMALIIPREGKINALCRLYREKFTQQFSGDSNPELYVGNRDFFIITSPVLPGDSGGLVFASRDGKKELVGLVTAYMGDPGAGTTLVVRINTFLSITKEYFARH